MARSTARTVRVGVKAPGGSRKPEPGPSRGREERVQTVMAAAKRAGLLSEKSGRIAGRVSPALVRQAKRHTGISADTDLIAFALASIALEDNFSAAFNAARGKIHPALKLGF